MYIIEVSQKELELIAKALDIYEAEPATSALTGSLIGTMLSTPDNTEETMARVKKIGDDATIAVGKRKLEVARVRVKLLEAMERPSEFQKP